MTNITRTLLSLPLLCSFALAAQAGGDPAAGQIIATEKCAACHSADGNAADPQYPRLAGQYADYIARALSEYKTGTRSNPIMAGFAAGLSEQDQKDVAAWFASQSGLVTPVEPRTVSD
jgi:cytochrome c553